MNQKWPASYLAWEYDTLRLKICGSNLREPQPPSTIFCGFPPTAYVLHDQKSFMSGLDKLASCPSLVHNDRSSIGRGDLGWLRRRSCRVCKVFALFPDHHVSQSLSQNFRKQWCALLPALLTWWSLNRFVHRCAYSAQLPRYEYLGRYLTSNSLPWLFHPSK